MSQKWPLRAFREVWIGLFWHFIMARLGSWFARNQNFWLQVGSLICPNHPSKYFWKMRYVAPEVDPFLWDAVLTSNIFSLCSGRPFPTSTTVRSPTCHRRIPTRIQSFTSECLGCRFQGSAKWFQRWRHQIRDSTPTRKSCSFIRGYQISWSQTRITNR